MKRKKGFNSIGFDEDKGFHERSSCRGALTGFMIKARNKVLEAIVTVEAENRSIH